MRTRAVLLGSLTITAVGFFVACGDPSPTKPSPLSASDFTTSIEVFGPDSLNAGQAAQFVANIHQSDGTRKSVRSMQNLRWRSSNPSVMSVNDSGMVFAGSSASGEATITAEITANGAVQGGRRVAINGSYALSVSAQSVTAGSPLSVSWVAPGGRPAEDWIAIFKAGSGAETYGDIWWKYTGGSTAGTFTIPAPAEPGLYEFRYFLDDGFDMAAKSSFVDVTTGAPASRATLLVAISATDGRQAHTKLRRPGPRSWWQERIENAFLNFSSNAQTIVD